jgi:predicted transcriptional regulator YdeE
MKTNIVEKAAILLVGFDFFGDPFRSYSGWSEENEIGRLWTRWMAYLENVQSLPNIVPQHVMYEVHIYHPETLQTGEFEVFVGVEVSAFGEFPPEVVIKTLPAGRYAVFTLVGQEIVSDWTWQLDHEWLPALGVRRQMTFTYQRYDARFKGTDAIDESELDVYVPL